jgi:serine/threonine protein kinase
VGTRSYQAPEILGIVQENERDSNYTKAVDLWSLGCVCFQLLTRRVPFPGRKALEKFCGDQKLFPTAVLTEKNISAEGISLITGLVVPLPSKRLTANTALHASWLEQAHEHLSVKGDTDKTMVPCRAEGSRHLEVVEASGVGRTKTVLEAEVNIAKILPLRSNILQVPNLDRSKDGAEQKSRIATQSHAFQSQLARSKMAAQLLLQNGYDVMQKDFNKEKALFWAARNGHDAAVQLLLKKGSRHRGEGQ